MTTSGTVSPPPSPTFTSYVRDRGPVLLRVARSLTSDPHEAEDLLQTALAHTYLAWDRIADHRALDGYVRRTLLNARTSQWRRRRVPEYCCAEPPEPRGVRSGDAAEEQAVRDAVWRAVRRLPPRQRAMVVLRYYEDFSEARTAEVMGVSVGTVKSAVSRALAKLRHDLALAADVAPHAVPGPAPEVAVATPVAGGTAPPAGVVGRRVAGTAHPRVAPAA